MDNTLEHISEKASEIADMFQDPLTSWWPWIVATLVGLLVCLKSYMGGIDCPSKARIDGKVVVVTGASGGIGLEIAKELSKRGAHLMLGCRDIQKGELAVETIKQEVRDAKVTLLPLDLSSFASVRKFASALDTHCLDILINNAGVVFHPEGRTVDGYEFHLQTNYLGHFLLTHLLLPKLRVRGGRIINISAVAHFAGDICLENLNLQGCFSAREAFAQSKLALVMMADEMAARLQGSGVTINALHPGMVRGTQHMRYSPFNSSVILKAPMLPWIWLFTKNPQQGAQTAVYVAVEPKLAKISGKYFADCEERVPSNKVENKELKKSLYETSCNITGVAEISKKFHRA